MSSKKEKQNEQKEINEEDKNIDQESLDKEVQNNDLEEEVSESIDIAEMEEKIKNLQDTVLRKAAEFENYKRRTENDQLNLLKYAAESFILKVIPVYDDLGRSVSHLDESNQDSIKEGLKLVFDKFTKILDEQGVKKLETEGKEFDVEFHEALMQQPSNEVPSNTILSEIEPGYIYKDKVIKHAKVIVSQEIEADNDELNKDEE
jgi:molecular chaperone GrpE